MDRQKNYISGAVTVTLGVIVVLTLVSFIPKASIGSVRLKRADIYSDVRLSGRVDNAGTDDPDAIYDLPLAAVQNSAGPETTTGEHTSANHTDSLMPTAPETSAFTPAVLPVPENTVAIEDYGTETPAMARFYEALGKTDKKMVRIAVLGDSYIEGDILTSDLREQLQELYGGRGLGFIPFSSNLPPIRATAKQTYTDWKSVSVMNQKSLTDADKERMYISGLLSYPEEGAVSRVEGTLYKKGLRNSPKATLIFVNEGSTVIDIVINDTIRRQYRPEYSPEVQQLTLTGSINSVESTFTNTVGFTGYGIVFSSDTGIAVDNYSIRGNSGYGLYQTKSAVNREVSSLIGGYDLVVIQYGQNVMSAEQTNYDGYSTNLVNMIKFVQTSFPGSSILVMGVGDRSSRDEGEWETMPAVYGMIRAQRKASVNAGVAFWNTFEGMGGPNSMLRYVENNWAAKDYTHLSYPGGKQIAQEVVKAIVYGKENHDAVQKAVQEAAAAELNTADSTAVSAIDGAAIETAAPLNASDSAVRQPVETSGGEMPAPAPTYDTTAAPVETPPSATASAPAETIPAAPHTSTQTEITGTV